jgi:prepilin-type N-terminal cleavage/methylation domain-containing protein
MKITRKGGVMMREKGFTLIELMVVVVIIGILAAIAIPNFMSMRQRAKEASLKSNMHTLQLSCEDFSTMAEGSYPETPTTTVGAVLNTLGFIAAGDVGNYPQALADASPGTRATVSTTANALLPGNNTYGNPFWPTANSLDHLAAVAAPGPAAPAHVDNPAAGADGEGTTYWGPVGTAGAVAMGGYVIYGDGDDAVLTVILRSGQ